MESDLPLPVPPDSSPVVTRVNVIHFADYHSHAVPYFSEHQSNQAGIARSIAYVKQQKQIDPNLIVLNGGDMFNVSTPAWSDKYHGDCTEWQWWNGLVTAMALGNHDVDYGWSAFSSCQQKVGYPVLSGNLADSSGKPLLSIGGVPYLVQQVGAIRIGLFALAGADFPALLKAGSIPSGATFVDPVVTARNIVRALREDEKVDAVIFFGHQGREADFAMAQQVPGIDLILGTHSHYKGDFQTISGTQTAFISPFQYLNYLSQVELAFTNGKLSSISGKLVHMGSELPEDPMVAANVAQMQKALESDPLYAPRFQVVGQAAVELDSTNIDRAESVLGNFVMDTLRVGAPANAAFSTASSFRGSLPPGPIRMEDYLTALPYSNKVLALTLTGADIQALLDLSASKRASDNFAVTAGLRYTIVGGKAQGVMIAKDLMARQSAFEPLDLNKSYIVMSTDFMAENMASIYRDLFSKRTLRVDTKQLINGTILDYIGKNSPVSAALDGRLPL
jgi:5'-nucleotidase